MTFRERSIITILLHLSWGVSQTMTFPSIIKELVPQPSISVAYEGEPDSRTRPGGKTGKFVTVNQVFCIVTTTDGFGLFWT